MVQARDFKSLGTEVCDLLSKKVFHPTAWIDHPDQTKRHPLLSIYSKILDLLISSNNADHINFSQRAELRSELGDLAGAVEDYDQYIKRFRKVVKSRSDKEFLAAALNHQAQLLIDTNSLERAKNNLKEAQEIEPDNGWHYETEGVLLERDGKIDRALECYKKAVSLDSEISLIAQERITALES